MSSTKSRNNDSVTKVVLLGTGTPVADEHRFGPATAIVVGDTPYLIDFGPGVVRRAAAAKEAGVHGLDVQKLKRAFVTHLHSDHTTGYPDLIFTPWVLGRDEPLEVYGPEGIRPMTENVLAAYQQDVHMRLFGLEPANNRGHRVIAKEIEPGVFYEDDNLTVEAFPVKHGSWPQAFGYKFRTPDKTIVISGDTAPTAEIIDQSQDCDILIHEVYSKAGYEKQSEVWKIYHSDYHTSSYELAEIASKAKPRLVVLYHQLFWGASEEELLSEIRSMYDGEVVSGKDLDVF
jgi:ribonuclease BN (tRNA processing enzyme)